jgi:glycosyltransferase involved in cell wall biosynthesis
MQSSKQLIITGMPLSGSSIVGQALFQAGLFLGDKLTAPARDSSGHFADEDIVRFHEEILEMNQTSWKACGTLDDIHVPVDYKGKGEELIKWKFGNYSSWGWKDPRTTLFLDHWDKILPDARWVFVVRKPAEVVWSFLSRDDQYLDSGNPVACALKALRLWISYNKRILAFSRKNPDRTMLMFVPTDFEENRQRVVNEGIIRQWSFGLRPIDFFEAYSPHLIKKKTPHWVAWLADLYRPAGSMLQELRHLQASLWNRYRGGEEASRATIGRDRAPQEKKRVVCVMVRHKFVYSETFVQAHIRRLPATVKLIHGEDARLLTEDDLPLLSPFERMMDAVAREFRVTSTRVRDRALRRYLRTEKAEAVLAEFGPTGVNVVEALQPQDFPLIVHFHGFDAYTQSVLEKHRLAYQKLFAAAAAVVAVSRDMVQQLTALGVPHTKLFYNPCGVDTTLFTGASPGSSPLVFISVGRFVDKKAPHLTLMAFKKVVEDYPDAKLVMIGDGPLWEACKQLTNALDITDKVAFPGVRPHAEIVAAMRTARGFVQHSLKTSDGNSEGTPVTVLEAGATGLPVVSTRHAGIEDVVIHGETGFLADEGDVEAMATYMIELARSPDIAAALGKRAQKHICDNFSMDRSIGELWKVIEGAMRKNTS